VADAALARDRFVAPIDVLTGLSWLRQEHAEAWRRGRVPYLERATTASLGKLNSALRILRRWAEQSGLQPRETVFVSWTPSQLELLLGRDLQYIRINGTVVGAAVGRRGCLWVAPILRPARRLALRASGVR
jgi:hypothetical protein